MAASSRPPLPLLQATMQLFQDYVEANSTIDEIYPAVEPICVFFINKSMHYYGPYMCPGIILSYGPVVSAHTMLVSMATIMQPVKPL